MALLNLGYGCHQTHDSEIFKWSRAFLVAIDYFTKWVEAVSYKSVTQVMVAWFLKHNIIYRYGVPGELITNNGMNLNGKMIQQLYQQFKIEHRNSVPYRPQMNGAVEAANKNIKKILVKMTDTRIGTSTFHLLYAYIALLFILPWVRPHIHWCMAWRLSSPQR